MNKKERMELAKWAITQAGKNGADNTAINIGNWRSIDVEYRDGKLDKLQESTQNYLNLAVYADKRYTSHSTNDLRKDSLGRFIEEAVAMTKYLSQDPYRSLPDPKYYKDRKEIDLHLLDADYESVTSDQRVKMAQEIEKVASSQSEKIVTCTSGYSDGFGQSVKIHSNGFEGERETTSFSAGVEVSVEDKEGARPSGWDWRTVRFFKDLPASEILAESAAKKALRKIGQTKLESGIYDLIIENRPASRIISAIYGPMSARSLQQKNSFLEGKLGEKIASEKLTLIDDPFIDSGHGSRLYDGEGMATRRRVMIDKGVLKSYYVDYYYGKKLDMEPTIGSATNAVIEPGTKSLDELIKQTKKGILVTDFIGGNSNSTTGDYSIGIVGLYIEDGQIIKPVNEMNITGNLLNIFNQLTDVGNDPYIYSSWRRPSLYFRDIEFSGI